VPVELAPDTVTFGTNSVTSDAGLKLSAEAFARLVHGRLDPAHTPLGRTGLRTIYYEAPSPGRSGPARRTSVLPGQAGRAVQFVRSSACWCERIAADPVNGGRATGRASGTNSVGPRRSPTTPYRPRPRSLPTGPTPALPAATSTNARRRSVSMSAPRCLARGLLGDIRAVRAERSDPGRHPAARCAGSSSTPGPGPEVAISGGPSISPRTRVTEDA
jgi:hypothetical protein